MGNLRKKLEDHSTIISVWSSIATIASVALSIHSYNQKQDLHSYTNLIDNSVELLEAKDQLIEMLETKIYSVNITGNGNGDVVIDSIINRMEMNPNNFSVDELLRQAEGEVDSKNYTNAYKLYTLDILKDNPVAQCNLGYLYSNGFGVEKDFDKAESLYIKSFEAGCNQALINRFVMYKNNITRENNYESKVYNMLNDAIKNETNYMHNSVVEKYGYNLFDGFIKDLRDKECQWDLDMGVEKVESRPIDTWRKRWYWISNTTQKTNNSYGRYQLWGYDERVCTFDEIFNEELAR